MTPLISLVGRHNSGKTTVLIALLHELKKRNLRAAVIKHSHGYFSFNGENDSDRLFNTGVEAVYAVSPDITLRYRRQMEVGLTEYLTEFVEDDLDLILLEGYKQESLPKIEILRQEIDCISMGLEGTLAIVSDFELTTDLVRFLPHEISPLCDFILDQVL